MYLVLALRKKMVLNGTKRNNRWVMSDKLKILVVDDQIAVAMMMVFLLTRAGCQAEAALTPEQALQRAQAEPFDLITVDIGMPCLNGFDLFERLKEIPQLKEIPVIFVTGQATVEDRRRAFEMGAADFIEKPFDAKDFISRVLSQVKPLPAYA
jgi:CheY-like chemotaxis protein